MTSSKIAHILRRELACEVLDDRVNRTIYSVDASIYEVQPDTIVIPFSEQDVRRTIAICRDEGVPIHPRGAATGIVGGCIGPGVVLDFSRHLNQILEIDYDQRIAVCQPGVVQDQLNEALSAKGYRLGPDTSTGNRATLGGMVGNNSAGARSLKFGSTADALRSLQVHLSDGECLNLEPLSLDQWQERKELPTREGEIYRELWRIRRDYGEEIQKVYHPIPRRATGYNLDALIEADQFNPCKLIAGSEGSLGIVSRVTVDIVPKPQHLALCVIAFEQIASAADAITQLLQLQPIALELIDDKIIEAGRHSPSLRGKLQWLKGSPGCLLVVEFEGDSKSEAHDKALAAMQLAESQHLGQAAEVLDTEDAMLGVWQLRKSGLGLLQSRRSYTRAVGFVEDITMPPGKVAAVLELFRERMARDGFDPGIYGHAGAGALHIRPFVNIRDPSDLQKMQSLMLDVTDLLLLHGGYLSGEHGDGYLRTWLNERTFGTVVYQAFKEVKRLFDPDGIMNPDKVVGRHPFTESLRGSPDRPVVEPNTFLDFSDEGGFALSADLCNGNAACRNRSGAMCPSFQGSGREFDTTRARAQALRSLVNQTGNIQSLSDPQLHKVLDLCLECKACKTECPSQVDMAKMKSEALYHKNLAEGVSWRTRLFTSNRLFNRIGSRLPRLANALLNSRISKKIMTRLGVAPQRSLPTLAEQPFSSQFGQIQQPQSAERVALFVDTYTEYHHPEIGVAAVNVLNAAGYRVEMIQPLCCGRPMVSKGMLPQAKRHAEALVDRLLPYAQSHTPIICLEPSCLSALQDDYRGLLHTDTAAQVASACRNLEEVLAGRFDQIQWRDTPVTIHYHGHCHHKALKGTAGSLELLRRLPGAHVVEIDSGCCGMAGSFGYEAEHYSLSMAIGRDRLFPAVEALEDHEVVVADGFSCRHQIEHGCNRHAVHIAQVLADRIENTLAVRGHH